MSRSLALLLSSVCLVARAVPVLAQIGPDCPPPPTAVYQNFGIATNAQVDAGAFVNWGDFSVFTLEIPWEAQNVRTWENRGLMQGSLGFRFNYTTCEGDRLPSDTFINTRTGSIDAFDGGGFSLFVDGSFFGGFFQQDTSYVFVDSQEVINRGNISVGPAGLIQLAGETVDLSGGTLIVNPLGSTSAFDSFFGGFLLSATNFMPDAGIYDLAWGTDINTNFNVGNLLFNVNPTDISSPLFRITNSFGWCNTFLNLTNAATWVFTSQSSETNFNIQVVAVETDDTNILTDVRWLPTTLPDGDPPQGGFLSAVVEFTSPATNIITLQQFTNRLYLFDQLASHTNYGLSDNLAANTFRPAPFVLSRFSPFFFGIGMSSNDVIGPDIFDSPIYSNRIATNIYAAYSAQVDYLSSRLPQIPDVGYTNRPGRVEVNATDLTMTAARIRGEGLVSIKATNFVGSASAIIDVPRLSYNLGSSQPTLRLQDLARERVQRFSGHLSAYSTIWTNLAPINPQDTNSGSIEIRFHLLLVDGKRLRTTEPVLTHELALSSSPNGQVVIEDDLTVTDRFVVDSENLVLNGRLSLQRGLSWAPENFTRLQNLTNNGFLQLTELAEFQGVGGGPLQNFVNRGTIRSFSHFISADYFENRGSIISTQFFTFASTNFCFGTVTEFTNSAPSIGTINVQANAALLDGGDFSTGGDIRLSGQVYKINQHGASAGGALFLDISDTLTDNGPQAENLWEVRDGFRMSERPEGDLFGTQIISVAEPFGIIDHTWAARDFGPVAAGFSNNVALGNLRLAGDIFSQFRFAPGVPGSALYVDVLEVDGEQAINLRNFTNTIRLLGMNIYYGDLRSTNENIHAEAVNGLQFGDGRMIWVPGFAGPNSGIDVALSPTGPSVRMNRALRESRNIDSDGDGIANLFDDFPLSPELNFRLTTEGFALQGNSFRFSFASRPNARYVIEFTEDLNSPDWQPLGEQMDSGGNGGIITFTDQVTAGTSQRYYRARLVQE